MSFRWEYRELSRRIENAVRPISRLLTYVESYPVGWSRFISFTFAICLTASLGGCATAPVQETKAFDATVGAVKSAGDLLFDTYAAVEKRNKIRQIDARKLAWTVEYAPYYATIGEPKDVAAFRTALTVVKQYSELLVALADANPDKAKGQILSIATSIGSIFKATQFAPAVELLSPLIEQGLRAQSIEEMRRIAFLGLPHVQIIVRQIRDVMPSLLDRILVDAAFSKATASTTQNHKMVVSNFVMLLDSLDGALTQMSFALEQPSSPSSLALLVQTATQLNADVVAARKVLALTRLAN